jgi:hypothetical protein
MRMLMTLLVAGIASLLIANETRQSAIEVLRNTEQYQTVWGVWSYEQYMFSQSVFTVCAIGCLLLAAYLLITENPEARKPFSSSGEERERLSLLSK